MTAFDWKGLVYRAAPALATALGGPFAGMAVRVLGETLLGDAGATEDQVAAAVASAKPEDLLRLRDADLAFKKHRADARRMAATTGDLWTPRLLAIVVILGFFASALAVFAGVADLAEPSTATLVGAVVGYASAKADQVVAYWFGSSAGSRAKTEELAAMARGQQ